MHLRVIKYLESQGVTSNTSNFEMTKQADDSLIISRWGYPDVQVPDLGALYLSFDRNEVVANDNLKTVRKMRNDLLAKTDYLFLTDAPYPGSAANHASVAAFRQSLRDLPQRINDPVNFALCLALFPQPPECISFINKEDVYSNKKQRV
jgi:hypothetical protein